MKRLSKFKLPVLVLSFAFGAFVFSMLSTGAQSAPIKDKDPKDPEDKKKPQPPPKPEPGSYKGSFNGKMAMVLREKGTLSPKSIANYKVVGKTIDLKANLTDMWNNGKAAQEAEVLTMLKAPIAGHRLYDAKISLATASTANKMYIDLSPKNKRVMLGYSIPGNKITCRADVSWWPDPTVRISFDLDLWIVIRTTGTAADPLVLDSAFMTVRNAKVLVNSDRNASAEVTLNNKIVHVEKRVQPAVAALNNLTLREFTNQGFSVVTPQHTLPGVQSAADLLLEMAQQGPVLTPR